jgi:hypothetical protein
MKRFVGLLLVVALSGGASLGLSNGSEGSEVSPLFSTVIP